MATVTQTFRPIYIGAASTNTYNNLPGITDSDPNTYTSWTRQSTVTQTIYCNYDLSSVPSNATVTDVSVDFVYLANTSSLKLNWYAISSWTTQPTATTTGTCAGAIWASSSGVSLTKSTSKTTVTKTGAQIFNRSGASFLDNVNSTNRSTFLSSNISITVAFQKASSSANVYFYDLPITITYTLPTSTITVNAGTGGTATGGGEYSNGATATLTATANSHYRFVNWTSGGSSVSTSNPYSFTVSADATYTANFALQQHTITTAVSPSGSGTVSGGGTYNYGSSVTLTATPATGYSFTQWSDGVTTASRTITVTGNATYTAQFALKQYAISTAVSPSGAGTATGGGTYNHGTSVTLTATPATGYDFDKWTKSGATVSTSSTYTFTATAAGTYTAVFVQQIIEPDIIDISIQPQTCAASQYAVVTVTMDAI